ncbi:MAG: ASCH domain-containing protein [Cyanobacteria bacterium J06635_15]
MDKAAAGNIVLMSIHPEFVDAILAGTKKVEFRKTKFASKVSHVVVYATHPVKKLTCIFEVKKVTIDHPVNLWSTYSKVSGICKDRFLSYYDSYVYGVAIEVGKLQKLDKQLKLSELGCSISPPQSYQYLDRKIFEQLKEISLAVSR